MHFAGEMQVERGGTPITLKQASGLSLSWEVTVSPTR
jgi:hypothetical protein